MIKYVSHAITFEEVPDEVCLTVQISNCPHKCFRCHSPYLRKDEGEDLERNLDALLDKYKGRATCLCLMGDGNDRLALMNVLVYAKKRGWKTALYSGYAETECPYWHWLCLDYLKTGPYIDGLGGLDSEKTNQRFYLHGGIVGVWCDITERFRKKKV